MSSERWVKLREPTDEERNFERTGYQLDARVGFLRGGERAEVDHAPAVLTPPADRRADMPARPTVRSLPSYAMRRHEEER